MNTACEASTLTSSVTSSLWPAGELTRQAKPAATNPSTTQADQTACLPSNMKNATAYTSGSQVISVIAL